MKIISMKNFFLFACVLFTLNGYAQSFNVQSAADALKDVKFSKTNGFKELSDAKRYIDLAFENPLTTNDPKMWLVRGKVYLAIDQDTSEIIRKLDVDAIEKSAMSFVNCRKTDVKENYIDDCNNNIWIAGVRINNKAVAALNKGDNEKASKYFSLALEIIPYDKDNKMKHNTVTAELITYNLSKAAIRSKDNAKAKVYLQKLVDSKYNDPMIYIYMSKVYLEEKDTIKALSYIEQGRKIFDENSTLLNAEISIYGALGKFDALISKFTDAINLASENELLYYRRASIYQNQKDNAKAEIDYKKAIELKPDFFEANYYLGGLYFNQAAELANSSKTITNNDDFESAKKKYEAKFKQAEPYLVTALDLNPKKSEEDLRIYTANLNSLKQLYARTGEMEKYNQIKAKLDQK